MPSEITLSVNTSEAIESLNGGAEHFLDALAEEIRDRFQDNVHVITGAMRASASVVTADGSDYAEHVAAAAALNPVANFAPEAIVGPQEAVVQVPVNYAAFEELGVTNRPGHPALVPAVEETVSRADEIARKVFGIE